MRHQDAIQISYYPKRIKENDVLLKLAGNQKINDEPIAHCRRDEARELQRHAPLRG